MAHYDSIRETESVAPPVTMRALAVIGMRPQATEDPAVAVFAGHGLTLSLPSNAELEMHEIMRLVVECARKSGAEEVTAGLRKLLGVR